MELKLLLVSNNRAIARHAAIAGGGNRGRGPNQRDRSKVKEHTATGWRPGPQGQSQQQGGDRFLRAALNSEHQHRRNVRTICWVLHRNCSVKNSANLAVRKNSVNGAARPGGAGGEGGKPALDPSVQAANRSS